MKPGLAALIHPHPIAELVGHMERSEPFVVHGLCDSVAELLAIPMLSSLETLLATWPEQVDVHLPDLADEASSITVPPLEARAKFDASMALLFNEVHRYLPELVPWLDGIRADLDLSALTQQRSLVYATPAGSGTAAHFDQNVNFVLHLHGTKTWFLAPNDHVERPLTRHTIGSPLDPELQSYATLPMPDAMPEGRIEIVLEPGSLLFVPRGVWHSTHATTDALSLNFTFSAPTWLDLFTAAIRGRLALSPAWRETAAPHSDATFEALLRELATDVASWTAVDILTATEGDESESTRSE